VVWRSRGISNKSGKTSTTILLEIIRTLTLRHGSNCGFLEIIFFANNNFFSGGIRVMGENHLIYNNI
jgi:poly(beta-D-mannuronate) lyase